MDKIIVDCTSGSVQIVPLTPDELAAIPSADPTPIDLLNKLDADNQLTQRNLRQMLMLTTEAFKQLSGGALDLSVIPGVAKAYEVEAQAEALRAQL